MTGDVDKRGNESKAVAKSRGLRVRLELKPGQMMAIDDPEELILNMNYNYAKDLKREGEKKPEVIKTMAGEEIKTEAVAPAVVTAASTTAATTSTTSSSACGSGRPRPRRSRLPTGR